MAELFDAKREGILYHLRNIYQQGELDKGATCKEILQVRTGGAASVMEGAPMEEKKYPTMEEEDGFGCMNAEESAVAYTQRNNVRFLNQEETFDYPQDYDPGFGPYSMEEMNARIDKAESDRDNPDKWIRVDDFWAAMRKEHLWL